MNLKEQLKLWCRYARVDDTRDNGVCEFTLKFRIGDEDMAKVMARLDFFELCDVAEHVLGTVCPGCEGFADDWKDPDNGDFRLDNRLEGGYVVLEGRYRT